MGLGLWLKLVFGLLVFGFMVRYKIGLRLELELRCGFVLEFKIGVQVGLGLGLELVRLGLELRFCLRLGLKSGFLVRLWARSVQRLARCSIGHFGNGLSRQSAHEHIIIKCKAHPQSRKHR